MTINLAQIALRSLQLAAIASTTFLSGCVAALPAIAVASTVVGAAVYGYLGYKVYQSASGAEIQIGFENDFVAQSVQAELAAANSMAFWPSPNRSLIVASERIGTTLGISNITPPATTAERLRSAGIATSVEMMTDSERASVFERAANVLDADFVLVLAEAGIETDTGLLSLRRTTVTSNYDVYLYSRASNTEVWTSRLIAEVGMGRNTPSQTEIDEIAGRAIADRLVDFSAGNLVISHLEGVTPDIRFAELPAQPPVLIR